MKLRLRKPNARVQELERQVRELTDELYTEADRFDDLIADLKRQMAEVYELGRADGTARAAHGLIAA